MKEAKQETKQQVKQESSKDDKGRTTPAPPAVPTKTEVEGKVQAVGNGQVQIHGKSIDLPQGTTAGTLNVGQEARIIVNVQPGGAFTATNVQVNPGTNRGSGESGPGRQNQDSKDESQTPAKSDDTNKQDKPGEQKPPVNAPVPPPAKSPEPSSDKPPSGVPGIVPVPPAQLPVEPPAKGGAAVGTDGQNSDQKSSEKGSQSDKNQDKNEDKSDKDNKDKDKSDR